MSKKAELIAGKLDTFPVRSPDQLKERIANPHIHSFNKYQQAPICVSSTVSGSGIRGGTCLYRTDIPGGSQTTNRWRENHCQRVINITSER